MILGGLILGIILLIGCVPNQPATNQPVANANTGAPVNANANQTAPPVDAASSRIPITLPVIDALLGDEGFVTELRRTVQPSDEQFDKLKNASRNAVLQLGENNEDEKEEMKMEEEKKEHF